MKTKKVTSQQKNISLKGTALMRQSLMSLYRINTFSVQIILAVL